MKCKCVTSLAMHRCRHYSEGTWECDLEVAEEIIVDPYDEATAEHIKRVEKEFNDCTRQLAIIGLQLVAVGAALIFIFSILIKL